MHGTLKNALLSGTILLAGFSVAASAPAKNTGTNSVVIVFKDGHQQQISNYAIVGANPHGPRRVYR